jgi:hypothetical protein
MSIVSDDDIIMYARGLLGRQGRRALDYAKDQSQRLADMNDSDGAQVWQRVAEAVKGQIQLRQGHRA